MPDAPNTDRPGRASADAERHRLARDPAAVDGLRPDKQDGRAPAGAGDGRADRAQKPYATERESYGGGAIDAPTDADQRRDGSAGRSVTGGTAEDGR